MGMESLIFEEFVAMMKMKAHEVDDEADLR